MTATQDDTIAELQRANAELRRERDAALLEKATLAEELAARSAEQLSEKGSSANGSSIRPRPSTC